MNSSSLARSSLYQLTKIRFLEFWREPEAVFWTLFFPILLATGLGVAFRNRAPDVIKIAIVENGTLSQSIANAVSNNIGLSGIVCDEQSAERDLATGKVALVGFSLGGGESLYYGSQWPDQVAGIVVWYPANAFIKNMPGFADRLQVPLVVFAGGKDNYRNGCCTAANDEALQSASKAAGKSFDLTVYPDANHDFVKGGANYNEKDYDDAFQRTADALKSYLAVP